MSDVTLDGLTEYEARALLMYIEVQNDGFLFHSAEKITAQPSNTGNGTFALTINCPANFPTDLFGEELKGARTLGYSSLDPQRERASTTRSSLPDLGL